jgi:hypothetical protein
MLLGRLELPGRWPENQKTTIVSKTHDSKPKLWLLRRLPVQLRIPQDRELLPESSFFRFRFGLCGAEQ